MIFKLLKRIFLAIAILTLLPNVHWGQELEFMDLGVIEGEFKRFKRTLTWTNNGEESVKLKLWSDSDALSFESTDETVAPGESVEVGVNISLPSVAGDYEYELRLLNTSDFVLQGYQFSFKVLQSEQDVFKAYRNVNWPFRSKEEVFNLKSGRRGDTLSAVFDVYNLGGADLSALDKLVVNDSIKVSFTNDEIKHNQFGRMKISFVSNAASSVGFHKTVVKAYQGDRLIMALPIQYSLLPTDGNSDSKARISTNLINHDFKVIKVGQSKEVVISLANNGSGVLKIDKMESNCDCLVFNKIESISPGTSQKLRVKFDAKGRLGLEKKTIAIFSNAGNRPVQVLTFRAHVK
ncbi:DUF1573 domain-containing protein [Roseivirga sp.]|uniref:DUF1573 domain-containing protein n=1 Tax=Roseivirga sp. TaxID=1964215 RepID=UPI003B8B82A4